MTKPRKRPAAKSLAATSRTARAEATRDRILDESLALFRKHGFHQTTMRDVAKAAGVSLGAAYYHFTSKEAIVLAYYERLVAEHERRCRELFAREADLAARIRGMYHAKLDLLRRDRKLIGVLVGTSADPESPISVFAHETAATRARAMAICREAIAIDEVPESFRDLAALALWTLLLGLILYFIHDDSPRQERTRTLVDGAVALVSPLAPFLAFPPIEGARAELERLLGEAGISFVC